MQITATLNLNNKEEQELADIIGCDKSELATALSPYASAALEEYVTMFLGQESFNSGPDWLKYRLFLLILYVFKGRIPDEQAVYKLLKKTSTSNRSLIRAVISKYHNRLKTGIDETIETLLNNVEVSEGKDTYLISVHNLILVEELNRELAEIDTNLPPVQKKRGSVSTYEILPSAYYRLCERHQLSPKPLDPNE